MRAEFSVRCHDGVRPLRSVRFNWLDDIELTANRVRVLIERDANGQADGGTRFQELTLHLEPSSGRVTSLMIRNGNHRLLRPLWLSLTAQLQFGS